MIDPTTIHTRTVRDGNGHRVYRGGDMLGKVEQHRIKNPVGGRMCTRWQAKAAAMAFLAPGCPLTGVPLWLHRPVSGSEWLPGEHLTKVQAIEALVAYLIEQKAPAVGFGPHPDVAAAPVRRATR